MTSIPVHPAGRTGVPISCSRHMIALSPDGAQMVYAADGRLYLRSMSELDAHAIQGTEGYQAVTDPVFSPDGRSVAFYAAADQTIKTIAVTGGAAADDLPGRQLRSASAGGQTASSSARAARASCGSRRMAAHRTCSCASRTVKRRMARRCCRAGSTCCSRSRPAPPVIDGTRRKSSCSR